MTRSAARATYAVRPVSAVLVAGSMARTTTRSRSTGRRNALRGLARRDGSAIHHEQIATTHSRASQSGGPGRSRASPVAVRAAWGSERGAGRGAGRVGSGPVCRDRLGLARVRRQSRRDRSQSSRGSCCCSWPSPACASARAGVARGAQRVGVLRRVAPVTLRAGSRSSDIRLLRRAGAARRRADMPRKIDAEHPLAHHDPVPTC